MSRLIDKFIDLTTGKDLFPPIANCSPFIMGSGYNLEKYFGNSYRDQTPIHCLTLIDENDSVHGLNSNKYEAVAAEVFGDYLEDQKSIEWRLKLFLKSKHQIENLYVKIINLENNVEFRNLVSYSILARDLVWELNAIVWYSTFLEKDFCRNILEKSDFQISDDAFEEVWNKVTQTGWETFETERQIDTLSLVTKDFTWKQIANKCRYIGASYHSIETEGELSLKFKEEFSKMSKNEASREIRDMQNLSASRADIYNKWLKKINPNQRILADYIKSVIYLRDVRKNIFGKAFVVMWKSAEVMFEKFQVDYNLIPFYSFSELEKGVEYFKDIKESLTGRKSGFVQLVTWDGEVKIENINYKKEKERLNKEYSKRIDRESNGCTINGQAAFKGKVRGVVKLIRNPKKDELLDGEILVTGMTRPEFISFVKKSSAIITDEGGITCHAAIVARELKKPCIIGTKIATQVLKDGDQVEVDADEGVVKVLKRNK